MSCTNSNTYFTDVEGNEGLRTVRSRKRGGPLAYRLIVALPMISRTKKSNTSKHLAECANKARSTNIQTIVHLQGEKMAPISSGRMEGARRGQKSTPHQKKHRWESFSDKISKLHSLDPLRRVRRHDLDAEDLSTTTSYLRNGLEKWGGLNMSKSFSSFKREILPLCGSLPQILHFEDKIMDLLASHITLQDKESLEALFDLLTAFAHDIGVRFEKYYGRSLELVVAIVSRPQEAEVIEWTFAAVAFLFKYLSRLLVLDLRPTYDALAPLLGKTKQPSHIVRFAAQALSFLVTKAAAPAHRESALPLIMAHVRDDFATAAGTRQFDQYYHGVSTLFTEAMKGTGQTLHSTGPDIFRAIAHYIPDAEFAINSGPWTWMVVYRHVLASIFHHGTAETLQPIVDAITANVMSEIDDENSSHRFERLAYFATDLGLISNIRRGSNVREWPAVVKTFHKLLEAVSMYPYSVLPSGAEETMSCFIVSFAAVWFRAPMEALIPSISALTSLMTTEHMARWYIPFCARFAGLDPDRYKTLCGRHFQR